MGSRVECGSRDSDASVARYSSPVLPRVDARGSRSGMDKHENHSFIVVFYRVHSDSVPHAACGARFNATRLGAKRGQLPPAENSPPGFSSATPVLERIARVL